MRLSRRGARAALVILCAFSIAAAQVPSQADDVLIKAKLSEAAGLIGKRATAEALKILEPLGSDPVVYCAWRSFVCSILMYAIYFPVYRRTRLSLRDKEVQKGIGAAIIAFFGYAVIVWAMKTA